MSEDNLWKYRLATYNYPLIPDSDPKIQADLQKVAQIFKTPQYLWAQHSRENHPFITREKEAYRRLEDTIDEHGIVTTAMHCQVLALIDSRFKNIIDVDYKALPKGSLLVKIKDNYLNVNFEQKTAFAARHVEKQLSEKDLLHRGMLLIHGWVLAEDSPKKWRYDPWQEEKRLCYVYKTKENIEYKYADRLGDAGETWIYEDLLSPLPSKEYKENVETLELFLDIFNDFVADTYNHRDDMCFKNYFRVLNPPNNEVLVYGASAKSYPKFVVAEHTDRELIRSWTVSDYHDLSVRGDLSFCLEKVPHFVHVLMRRPNADYVWVRQALQNFVNYYAYSSYCRGDKDKIISEANEVSYNIDWVPQGYQYSSELRLYIEWLNLLHHQVKKNERQAG